MSSKTKKTPLGAPTSSSAGEERASGDAGDPRKIAPKLRFPEFRDAEGWKKSVLAGACEMQAGKFVAASNIADRNKTGLFRCFGGNGLRGYTQTHTHDGTYPLIGRQGALCGNVRIVEGQFHATEHAVVVSPKDTIDVVWLYYSLDLLNLNRFATGQAQPGLSVDVLKNVSLAIPTKRAEQKTIAECLSAVDEVIAAQARKLDALKSHKKGLMQELFPREGETLPKLRFPEFRDAGEWTTVTLGSVASISTEKVGDKTCIPMSITSGVGLVSQMEKFGRIIAGSSYKNYLLLKMNDFAYNKSATKEYPEGFIALYCGDEVAAVPNSIFTCFRIKSHLPSPQYLNYLFLGNLHGQWLRKFIEVGARAHGSLSIDEDDLLAMPVPLPKGESSLLEQQKIADCLTSLDDLITIQAQKLDALKTHKKGLMQQLFPSPEEVEV